MSNRVKKQHYISKCYLTGFGIQSKKNDLLWVRDPTKRWRKSRPEKEATEHDFQTLVGEDGTKSDDIEVYLATVENDFKPMLLTKQRSKNN